MKRRLRVRVAAWNTHNAPPAELERFIEFQLARGAHAIVLNEVWRRYTALAEIARRHDLVLVGEPPRDRRLKIVPEQGSTVLLLAPSFGMLDQSTIVLRQRWEVFSTRRTHEPRRLIRVLGMINGWPVELLAVHGPTAGNVYAAGEFKGEVARVLTTTYADTLAIAVGDFNVRLPDARKWVGRLGLRANGHGPDLAVSKGRIKSRKLGRGTSDHYRMVHTIKAPR